MRGSLWRGVSDATYLRPALAEGTRVVELGCGDGKFLLGLSDAGFQPIGVDFAHHAIKQARGRSQAPLVLADLRALPFRDGSVPALAARYALGALDQAGREAAAGEVARVLAADGMLLVEEFSTQDFRSGAGREVEPRTYERNRGILTHYFERDEIAALFPRLRIRLTEAVVSRQRTGLTMANRHRWRWILDRQDSGSSKVSKRVDPGGGS
jgi:ubiquinone/menaquinone biosynthesis C-methylase UbiE